MTFDFAGANKISPIVEMTKKQYRCSTLIALINLVVFSFADLRYPVFIRC
jgi:hypothetical protein